MSKTLDIVISDLKDRELKGLREYGVTVAGTIIPSWIGSQKPIKRH